MNLENKYISIKSELVLQLIKRMESTEYTVFWAILMNANEFGEADISQRQLAELTNLSVPTINKAIKRIIEVKFNGQHVIRRTIISTPKRKNHSVYTLNNSLYSCVNIM